MREPPEIPDGVLLHRKDWAKHHVNQRRLASDAFIRVFPGWFTPTTAPATLNEICRVLQTDIAPGAIISHTTAAVLYGIPLPLGVDGDIGLLSAGAAWKGGRRVVPSLAPPRKDGSDENSSAPVDRTGQVDPGPGNTEAPRPPVIHCWLPHSCTSRIGGTAVVHRPRKRMASRWMDLALSPSTEVLRELATMLPLWDVVAAVEGLVGPAQQITGISLADVRAYTESTPRLPGLPRLREAVTLSRDTVESPMETYTRLLLVHMGFPEPAANLIVEIPGTHRTRRLDGGWEQWKVGFEYDGKSHAANGQWEKDEARRDELRSLGWNERRLTHKGLREPLGFLLRLRRTLDEHGAPVPTATELKTRVKDLSRDAPALMFAGRPSTPQ
jgi:hypothetical protein